MKQQVERVLCDVCLGSGGREEAVHHWPEGAPVVLDLCDRHYKEYVEPVVDLLGRYGWSPAEEPPPPKKRRNYRSGPFLCKVEGCLAAPLKHSGTMWQHLVKKHGINMHTYRDLYGDPVPLTPEEQASLVIEARCPVEGCSAAYSTELGNRFPEQALMSHMWGHHAIKYETTRVTP